MNTHTNTKSTCKLLLIKLRDASFPESTIIPCHRLTSVPGVSHPFLTRQPFPCKELKTSTRAWFANRRILTADVVRGDGGQGHLGHELVRNSQDERPTTARRDGKTQSGWCILEACSSTAVLMEEQSVQP